METKPITNLNELREYLEQRRDEAQKAVTMFRSEAIKLKDAGKDWQIAMDREHVATTRANLYAEIIGTIENGRAP